MIETAEEEPEHEAAKLGVVAWFVCKHCPAWFEWADDDELVEAGAQPLPGGEHARTAIRSALDPNPCPECGAEGGKPCKATCPIVAAIVELERGPVSRAPARVWPAEPERGEDGFGRRVWVASWEEPDGVFRREIHFDGKPVGHRRGQVFNVTRADMAERFPGAVFLDREPPGEPKRGKA